MANICFTDLKITWDEDRETPIDDKALVEFIDENIAYDGETHIDSNDDEYIEMQVPTKWRVPTEELQAMCKQFQCNVRAVGREDGMGFIQVVCVDTKGKVVQNEEIDFKF